MKNIVKGTKLINKLNSEERIVIGFSSMSNGKRTWECAELDNGSRIAINEIEANYNIEENNEVKEIAKFKVDGTKNNNARTVKIYDFSKEEVKIGYTLINGKEVRKTVKKYTFKNGEWCFYIKHGYQNICVYDWQIIMTDEWMKEEFKNFKKYKAC